jgi:NAD(P)-dependent dehydrogenase (short-subunit alcohol dehydrogenase family)
MKLYTIFTQLFPPKSTYSVEEVPDLSGKTVIVTGANTGLGKEVAKVLLARNAKVYIAARNQEKTEAAIKDLKEQTGKEALWLKLDLADLAAVKAAAQEFLSKENELHILYNNAGVYAPPVDKLTAQGYDLSIGTNVLGHFYFTKLLIPALLAGSTSSSDGKARVVNISSVAAYMAKSFDLDMVQDLPQRMRSSPNYLYAQSKLGNILFSNQLAKKYGDQGVISSAVHPGPVKTDLYRDQSFITKLLVWPSLYPLSYGVTTPLWAGTSPEGLQFNGKYLMPWARVGTELPPAVDDQAAEDLWGWCEDQVANI